MKAPTNKLLITIIATVALLLLVLFFLIHDSSKLTVTHYTYSNSRIPEEFDDFTIVQLSDIHCKNFGENNKDFIDAVTSLQPDVIFLTGDMIDEAHSDLTPLRNLFAEISTIAPIYAISGNHECHEDAPYHELLSLYEEYQITDLDDKEIYIVNGDASILVKGLGAFQSKIYWDNDFMTYKNPDVFSILLNHYANQFPLLPQYGYDLILSGHIHGGIIRLPGIGGLIGNGGNLFPEYDAGFYKIGNSTMIVSRGIGVSVIPRINNNPEIVCITLNHP